MPWDAGSERDQVAQRGEIRHLRVLRVKHLHASDGAGLQAALTAWFRPGTEELTNESGDVVGEREKAEQRELVDWRYQVGPDGSHHVMLIYSE